MPVKIILADDDAMFREMLLHALTYRGDNYVIMAHSGEGKETLNLVARYQPDILLLDYSMPGLGRMSSFCKEVTRRSPTTRILVLSGYSNEAVALETALGGAKGYVVKGSTLDDLLNAIKTVQMGGTWVDPNLPRTVFDAFLRRVEVEGEKIRKLTKRELQVLSLVAHGLTNNQIARRLYIDKRTVKNHLTHIFQKLGVTGRQQAARLFLSSK